MNSPSTREVTIGFTYRLDSSTGALACAIGCFFSSKCTKQFHFVGNRRVFNDAIGRFNEPVIIHPGIGRQGNNQTDVGSFRGFNRTDSAVVGRMNVPHLKTGAFPRQATGSQCAEPPFVALFRKADWSGP